MKNIYVVYSTWLSNHVGPSRSLTRFKKNKNFFNNMGIDLKIYSPDLFKERNFSFKELTFKQKIRRIVINNVLKLSRFNAALSYKVIENKYYKNSKNIVDYFCRNSEVFENEKNVIVFHELFTAYFYITSSFYNKSRDKIVLFQHANGEFYKMLYMYFPKIESSSYGKVFKDVEKKVLDNITCLGFISNNARTHFLKLHPEFNEEKTSFFHNGIEDVDPVYLREIVENRAKSKVEGYYRLLCVGTVNERKGQHLLLEAVAQLEVANRKKLHITFLGNGPDIEKLEEFASNKGISGSVSFKGGVNDVDKYLEEADIFILPSKDEGLPLSIIEAMRLNIPIVSTNIAGIPEMIVNETSGLLVEPVVEDFVNVLSNLDMYEWPELGKESRVLYEEKFTLNNMMEKYCKIVKEI